MRTCRVCGLNSKLWRQAANCSTWNLFDFALFVSIYVILELPFASGVERFTLLAREGRRYNSLQPRLGALAPQRFRVPSCSVL